MLLGEITKNIGNHQHIAFHSNLLDMLHPCISYVNIFQINIIIAAVVDNSNNNNDNIVINNNNFPICYLGCIDQTMSFRNL